MPALALMFAIALSAPFSQAASKAEAVIECEFYLTDPAEAGGSLKWLHEALVSARGEEAAHLGYAPTAAALGAVGLTSPLPRHSRMKIQTPMVERDPYWIRIYSESGAELASVPFHVPPVTVWKTVRGWGDDTDVELDRQIGREDASVISVGGSLGEFRDGRVFVAVRRRMANLVTVAIGVDVRVEVHGAYSASPEVRVVALDENTIMSRIEVVKAHFRVPQLPARNRSAKAQ